MKSEVGYAVAAGAFSLLLAQAIPEEGTIAPTKTRVVRTQTHQAAQKLLKDDAKILPFAPAKLATSEDETQ